MTPTQVKQFSKFVYELAEETWTRHLSPDQVRFRIAQQLSHMNLLTTPRRFARRLDGSVIERTPYA